MRQRFGDLDDLLLGDGELAAGDVERDADADPVEQGLRAATPGFAANPSGRRFAAPREKGLPGNQRGEEGDNVIIREPR